MKKISYLLAFIVVMGFVIYKNDRSIQSSSSESSVETKSFSVIEHPNKVKKVVAQREEIHPSNLNQNEGSEISTINNSEISRLHEAFPDESKVEQDIRENPHGPSRTLMTFAQRLGPLMEKAFVEKGDAGILIKELAKCAQEESVADSARAMCVTNVERLEEKHSDIRKTAKDLRSDVSPEVQKILDTNDAFIRKKL